MQNDVVELVFILDRSGSMAGLEKQTIDGFNEMIAKQKSLPGKRWYPPCCLIMKSSSFTTELICK